MIQSISSNLTSFQDLNFKPGLNILLADKTEKSSDTDSRNGVGKTSLIELIHFLLGASAPKDSIFRRDELVNSTFNLTFQAKDLPIEVSRSGTAPNSIIFREECVRNINEVLSNETPLIQQKTTNKKWSDALGKMWFDLPIKGKHRVPYNPTFRSLFPYFARRQNEGGFHDPMEFFKSQQTWNKQVSLSYLLGLNWQLPAQFESLRKKKISTDQLIKLSKDDEISRYFKEEAEIETQLTIIKKKQSDLAEILKTFKVVPKYNESEIEATEITKQIDELNEKNLLDNQLIQGLEESLSMERVDKVDDIPKVYEEVNFLFPEIIKRRIDEVQRFQVAVVRNRQSHLQDEITSAKNRVHTRHHKIEKLDNRRKELMEILKSGGALEQFTSLQEEAGRFEAERIKLSEQLELAREIKTRQLDIETNRNNLAKELRDELFERKEMIDEIVLMFLSLSGKIYNKPGSFNIIDKPTGPQFDVKIAGERSKGISNMQIFCFDQMLMEFNSKRNLGPGFLIHDSHLFDGVDERQVAKALQIGASQAEEHGFQYIVTLNSVALPRHIFDADFHVDDYILPTVLTDKMDSGRLFGLRF